MSRYVSEVELSDCVLGGEGLLPGMSWCEVFRRDGEAYTDDVLRAAVYIGVNEMPSVLTINSSVRRVAEKVLSDTEYHELSRKAAYALITEAPGVLRGYGSAQQFVEDVLGSDELCFIRKGIGSR